MFRRAATVPIDPAPKRGRGGESANTENGTQPPDRPTIGRVGGLCLAAVLFVGAVAADRYVGAPKRLRNGSIEASLVAAHLGSDAARSTAWFCAVGTASDQGTADLLLELGNLADRDMNAGVTVVDDAGHRGTTVVRVGAHSRVVVRAGDVLVADRVAAIVEGDAALVVEHTVRTPHGASTASCATVASSTWHFADGATTKDARLQLALFNPFPEEAVVDATFATERGVARPLALQGIVVPAGQVRVVDVGDSVRRRTAVAADVRARVGRIVAEELQVFDGSLATRGSALVAGSPALSDVWFVPRVALARGITERLAVHNASAATVHVEIRPEVTATDLDPIALTLAGTEQVIVDLGDDDRLPRGTAFSLTVTGDAPSLVVQRTLLAVAPARRRGVASAIASPVGSTRWVLAGGASTARQQLVVSVFNPTDTPTTVTMRELGSASTPAAWTGRSLAPGALLEWRVGDELAAVAPLLEVTSTDAEIVVQRDLTAAAAVGGDTSPQPATGSSAGGARLPAAVSPFALSRRDTQVSLLPSSSSSTSTSTSASTTIGTPRPVPVASTAAASTPSLSTSPSPSTSTSTTSTSTASTSLPASPRATASVSSTASTTASTADTPSSGYAPTVTVTVADPTSASPQTSTSPGTATTATTIVAPGPDGITTTTVVVRRPAVAPIRRPGLGISSGMAIPAVPRG